MTLPLVSVAMAQDLSEVKNPQEQEVMQIVYDLNRQEKIFKPLALRRMLREANILSEQLKLPISHPIQPADLTNYRVSSPWFSLMPDTSIGLSKIDKIRRGKITAKGVIETSRYNFGFADGLFSVVNRLQLEEVGHYQEWIKTQSLIDGNEAYQLATQWLSSVEVNVSSLEKKHGDQRRMEQSYIWNPPGSTNKSMLPIFSVSWGNDPTHYIARVRVLGTTKELLSLEMGDPSFSRRPALALSSVADFDKYLKAQTNLPVMHLQHPKTNPVNLTNSPPSF